MLAGARRGGRGRKLQLDAGRAETRVKISEMRRCWTAVSCSQRQWMAGRMWGRETNELGVELGQPGLTVVVEDQHGVDHRCSMPEEEVMLGCGLEFGHVKAYPAVPAGIMRPAVSSRLEHDHAKPIRCEYFDSIR